MNTVVVVVVVVIIVVPLATSHNSDDRDDIVSVLDSSEWNRRNECLNRLTRRIEQRF